MLTDTVGHPHAVVVHLEHALATHAAVVRHRRLVPRTRVAPPPARRPRGRELLGRWTEGGGAESSWG
eukprot:44232-Chlamydomonas_euryale.AAC.1